MSHTVGDVQDMCKSGLSHTVGTVGRYVGHRDSTSAGGLRVNDIIARGQHADITQLWQMAHDFIADDHLIGNDHFGILASFQYFFRARTVINLHRAHSVECLPRQVSGVQAYSI